MASQGTYTFQFQEELQGIVGRNAGERAAEFPGNIKIWLVATSCLIAGLGQSPINLSLLI